MVSEEGTAITCTSLTKYYGEFRGIENVDLSVEKGTIHGFLGPNGAGKTTTIRILVGLLKPTGGSATIFDQPAGSLESRRKIGYLPSDFELYSHYTVGEYLDFIESIRGSAPRRKELVNRFQLDEGRLCKDLSRGNRQKVGVVQAFMHDPEIVIADEPTTGLDPLMQEEFNKLLIEYTNNGGTVFLSSHILAEVQEVCSHVTVIKEGSIVATGKVDELLSQVPRKAILRISDVSVKQNLEQNPQIKKIFSDGLTITVYYDSSAKDFLNSIPLDKIDDILLPPPTLEDYFLPIYQSEV
ncbi:MAG: ABC transporter ATP-binding protein [Methanobacteriota archaeon]|nr:MAG: ABC transporter ATP-binding protein [Euryarchaeota archaeon]